MRDLREDLEPTWRALARGPAPDQGGRVIMFVSALNGEGVTSMAASFAALAARRSEKPVWLLDFDLKRNSVFKGFEQGFASDVGHPGRAYDASLRLSPIYALSPARPDAKQDKLLTAHEIDGLPLMITRFRTERVAKDQSLSLSVSADWMRSLRKMTDWVIMDVPALERAPVALKLAAMTDAIVLVVQADRTRVREVERARHSLASHGGCVVGAVLNQIGADARLAGRFSA